jgi:hypothetical protein
MTPPRIVSDMAPSFTETLTGETSLFRAAARAARGD